jgi:type VI secretion system protein ImpJ
MSQLKADDIVDAIQWQEGMLLAPQHFQQCTLRQDQLLPYVIHTVSPFFWGVGLPPEMDLSDNILRISKLEAIMPDGLVVALGAKEDLSLDFTPHLEQIKTSTKVYLRVPSYNPNEYLINKRYELVEGPEVVDANTGKGGLIIRWLKPQLSLSIGQQVPSKFTSFPIAEVNCRNEKLALTDFIPPTWIVESNSPLGHIIKEIILEVRGKVLLLSKQTQPVLYCVTATLLPQLDAMLKGSVSHPYAFYLILYALASSITEILTTSEQGLGDIVYKHNDLKLTFEKIVDFIRKSLASIPRYDRFIHFHYHRLTQHFTLKPEKPNWLKDYFIIGAKIPDGSREERLVEWMMDCLIGSNTKIDDGCDTRIIGLYRSRIEKKEDLELISCPRNVVPFCVKANRDFLDENQELHIFNPWDSSYRPAEILFFVFDREQKFKICRKLKYSTEESGEFFNI